MLARAAWLASLLIASVACAANAAEPKLEKIDVFPPAQGGYDIYRIPSLVVTPRDTLLAICEARKGRSDWGTIEILLRRSTDGGRTWDTQRRIAHVPGPHQKNPVALKQKLGKPDDVTYNNPVPIVDRQTGAVHLLFCLEYGRAFYQRSDDDGQTFSTPAEITPVFNGYRPDYDWRVLATGPGHAIQLRSGRLVVPVWLSTGTGGTAHRPSVVTTIYSDNHGATWQRGQIVANETDPLTDPNETVAVELADGRVMLNIRHESTSNRRATAISPDGATGWTRPKFEESLYEPICMSSLLRLSTTAEGGKNRLLFANPHNLDVAKGQAKPGSKRDRKNLSVKLSYDEGQTWPVSKPLEPGASAYSDLAVGSDGTIYCLYEHAVPVNKTQMAGLVLARFNLEWLTDGADSLAKPNGK